MLYMYIYIKIYNNNKKKNFTRPAILSILKLIYNQEKNT